jgi:TIR domain
MRTMEAAAGTGVRIFISYAHEDEALKIELDKHLKVLRRSSNVAVWSDRELVPGSNWDDTIMLELRRADIVLLLISVDFNASDFIWDKELAVALERHQAGTARVVPIILRRCEWQNLPYSGLQALPRNATPVTEHDDRDLAYTEIAHAISQLVGSMGRG